MTSTADTRILAMDPGKIRVMGDGQRVDLLLFLDGGGYHNPVYLAALKRIKDLDLIQVIDQVLTDTREGACVQQVYLSLAQVVRFNLGLPIVDPLTRADFDDFYETA